MRKIIQIWIEDENYWALCNDGTVWWRRASFAKDKMFSYEYEWFLADGFEIPQDKVND